MAKEGGKEARTIPKRCPGQESRPWNPQDATYQELGGIPVIVLSRTVYFTNGCGMIVYSIVYLLTHVATIDDLSIGQ